MKLSRDQFIEQFAIPLEVHCLRRWPRRWVGIAPMHLTSCLHEWMGIAGCRLPIKLGEFADIARPVIEKVHRATPRGERPTSRALVGALYDALDADGVEVSIKPPIRAHG